MAAANDVKRQNLCKALAFFISMFVALIIALGLIFGCGPWTDFTLNDVKVYAFNISSASTLTSILQISLSSRNDEGRCFKGFHFDNIDVYASYRRQQITPPTTIPPMYLHCPDVIVLSPYLNGTEFPLTPDSAVSLAQDQTATMLINVKVRGKIRLKFLFITGVYRFKVDCPAYIVFGNNNVTDSNVIGSAVKHPIGDVNYPFGVKYPLTFDDDYNDEGCRTHIGWGKLV